MLLLSGSEGWLVLPFPPEPSVSPAFWVEFDYFEAISTRSKLGMDFKAEPTSALGPLGCRSSCTAGPSCSP